MLREFSYLKISGYHRDSGGMHHEIGVQLYYQQLFDLDIDDYLFQIVKE